MSNQEDDSGYCFRCPVQAPHSTSTSLQRRDTLPPPLQSSYPLLAVDRDLFTPRTNPLIRAVWSPRPFSEFEPKGIWDGVKPAKEDCDNDLQEYYIFEHEMAHLNTLSQSPAKDVLRLNLALSYNVIHNLLFAPSLFQSDFAWWLQDCYTASTNALNENIKHIMFVEELFANVFSIQNLEQHIHFGRMWKGFKKPLCNLEQRVLRFEDKCQPGFHDAYKRARLVFQTLNVNDRARIMPLFQPTSPLFRVLQDYLPETSKQFFGVLRIYNYLDNPASAIVNLSLELISQWKYVQQYLLEAPYVLKEHLVWCLKRLYELDWESSERLIKLLSSFLNTPSLYNPVFLQMLLEVSYSKDFTSLWLSEDRRSIKTSLPSFAFPALQQLPKILFERSTFPNATINVRKMDVIRSILLFYEGLRQQLYTRKGLICPFNQGDNRCRCPLEYHKGLEQLYHLVKKRYKYTELPEWNPLSCHY